MLGGIVPWWGLVVLATAIMAWLLIWLWRAPDRLTAAALGLVIGGALGNVIDRLRYQAVPDFLDFHFGTYHWPSFNLADVAIFLWSGPAVLGQLSCRERQTGTARTRPPQRKYRGEIAAHRQGTLGGDST